MKFAEMTQEVQVARPQEINHDIGLTPGRRRMHQLARDAPGNSVLLMFCTLISKPFCCLSFTNVTNGAFRNVTNFAT